MNKKIMHRHAEKQDDFVWWKHGVIYQIYPRSFYDSNGDGIGDIPGITMKLDYLQDLGVDAIWLSPVYKSPMYDFGYDVSDFRAIDPVFGTLEDFDILIREAHRRGIRCIMDLVLNHTSHLHPWFLASRSSRRSPKRDWYIWHNSKHGKAPNNWAAAFGGSAWEYDELTCQYYLHSFLREQPDLNWRNRALRKEMYREICFWLDRGVDGFRLDAVNWIVKDRHFRSNPSWWPFHHFLKEPYHRNRPGVHEIMKEFRGLMDEYPHTMAVGEVFALPPGNPKLAASFLGDGTDQLHLTFDFSLLYKPWNAKKIFKAIARWHKAIPKGGWPSHVLSNHDQPRSIDRFGEDAEKKARIAAILLLTLKGTPFLYYGEEIGLQAPSISKSQMVDPLGKRYWPFYKGRDRGRTPMQWNSSPNGGFTTHEPWLPLGDNYTEQNVETQDQDPYSILNLHRELISLRKENKALQRGKWLPLIKGDHNTIAYLRHHRDQTMAVLLNLGPTPVTLKLKERAQWIVCLSTHRFRREHYPNLTLTLAPYEGTILERLGDL